MKKLKSVFYLLFIFSIFSPATAQIKHFKKAVKGKVAPHDQSQDKFTVVFPKKKSTAILNAYMMGIGHPVTFVVNVTHGKLLKAEIKEMFEPANIRITQVFAPDGMSDGPFSHTLVYPIKRKGIFKIIVGGNNMQGDDWKGVFTMRVTIQ